MLHHTLRPTPRQCDKVVLDQTHGSNKREKNGFEVQMVHSTHQTRWRQHHRLELERDQIARIGNEKNRYLCLLYGFACDLLFKASHLDWSGLRFKFGDVFLWRTFRTLISEFVSSFLWHHI